MDLLQFGMKNQNSSNVVKRKAAEGALQLVKWQADRYEQWLEKREIVIPEAQGETETMLKQIYAAIEQQTAGTR